MWKKEETKPQAAPESAAVPPVPGITPSGTRSTIPAHPGVLPVSPRAAACISQGIKIKGEVTGSEDLFVDGQVDGTLNLTNGNLTIGPNGNVKADVHAREVIVRGKIEGKITGREKVQLWSTGQVTGEVQTDRLAIEEGALLRGKVEAGKHLGKSAETKAAAAGVTSDKSTEAVSLGSGTTAV